MKRDPKADSVTKYRNKRAAGIIDKIRAGVYGEVQEEGLSSVFERRRISKRRIDSAVGRSKNIEQSYSDPEREH